MIVEILGVNDFIALLSSSPIVTTFIGTFFFGDDILTMHRFTVNQYGLLISLSTTAKNNAKKIISETTIFVEYNINFEKLSEL